MVSQAMIETITFFEVVTSTFLLDILGSVTHLLVATPRMLLHINGKFTKEKLKPSFVIKFCSQQALTIISRFGLVYGV
jgi:hypothetical protein